MSASATPRALMALRVPVIAAAAASRAALTVGLLRLTPRYTRATSGTTVTLPLPDTVRVWMAKSLPVTGAPATGPVRTDRAATATIAAPSRAAPTVRTDWDMRIT